MTNFTWKLLSILKGIEKGYLFNVGCPIHPVFILANKLLENPKLFLFFKKKKITSVIKDFPLLNAIILFYSY